jgi:dihydrodipicolinate reductase
MTKVRVGGALGRMGELLRRAASWVGQRAPGLYSMSGVLGLEP